MRTAFTKVAIASCLLLGAHMAVEAEALGTISGTTTVSAVTTGGSFADVFSFTPSKEAFAGLAATSISFSSLYGATVTGLSLYEGIFSTASAASATTPVSMGAISNTVVSGAATIYTLANSAIVSPVGYTLVISGNSVGVAGYTGIIALIDRPRVLPPVPEPESYAMLLAGLGMMGFIARRRKKSL